MEINPHLNRRRRRNREEYVIWFIIRNPSKAVMVCKFFSLFFKTLVTLLNQIPSPKSLLQTPSTYSIFFLVKKAKWRCLAEKQKRYVSTIQYDTSDTYVSTDTYLFIADT